MATNPADQFGSMRGKPAEEARFYWNGGPVRIADRTWFVPMLSGVTAFETDEGLVLVDSGAAIFASHLAGEIRQATAAPVHTAVFTHGHVDHAFGLSAFLTEDQTPPRVIAQSAMPHRFERYAETSRHNAALNARQFGGSVDNTTNVEWAAPSILPDTLYDDELSFVVGGVTFELHAARGETDDHTWLYCPERSVLCPGDLIIWAVPNAGNPQKVQRYPWDWAAALRVMATVGAHTLAPGHGGPIIDDPDLVGRVLTETAEFLEVLVERTIAVLEDGSPPHVDVVRRVEIPVSDSPWLQPGYDEAEFIIRNIIRWYGGWYSGRPSELKPAPRADVADAIAQLAGGPTALIDAARRHADGGDLRLACHLADYALEAAPQDSTVTAGVAELYDRRAESEDSLMAVNLYRSAAAYARAGRPFS